MKPSELFCFKDTINFAASLFFLAAGNKKFFSKFRKSNFLRSRSLLYKIVPTNLGVSKPTFYTFYTSHLRRKSTMRRCIYHSDLGKMQYFTIFQDKLHSVNIQDDQSWAFSKTVQNISKITYTVNRFSLLTSSKFSERAVVACSNKH